MRLPRFQLPREAEALERALLGTGDVMPLHVSLAPLYAS